MIFFLCSFSISANIFISNNADSNQTCEEMFPCSVQTAFEKFVNGDFIFLTEQNFSPNQTDQFLSRLSLLHEDFSIIGNNTIFHGPTENHFQINPIIYFFLSDVYLNHFPNKHSILNFEP